MSCQSLLILLCIVLAIAIIPTTATTLRRSQLTSTGSAWRLLQDATTMANTEMGTKQEKIVEWIPMTGHPSTFRTRSIPAFVGNIMIAVFHDRSTAPNEAALVEFDVRSNANCVVSVCGKMRNWYLSSTEQCWDLRVAPKSSDNEQDGLIRNISADYTATRPAASQLYLKFDAVNYIDGSICQYEVLSGTKVISEVTTPV